MPLCRTSQWKQQFTFAPFPVKTRLTQTHSFDAVSPHGTVARATRFTAIDSGEQRITQTTVAHAFTTAGTKIVTGRRPAAIVAGVHGFAPALGVFTSSVATAIVWTNVHTPTIVTGITGVASASTVDALTVVTAIVGAR